MIDTVQKLLRTRMDDDSVAVISPERTWTWREYLAGAAAEASALLALLDPARPRHVGALMTNSPAYVRSMAAAALGGYVLCGINTTRRGEGLRSDITRSDCQLLLVDDDHAPLIEGLDLSGVTVLNVAGPRYTEAVATAKKTLVPHEVTGTDPFMMIFTSGTSGNPPKAVPFVHTMSVMCGLSLVAQMDITAEDVCYLAMPLFHSNGVAVGFSVAVTAGAAMVPVKFSVSRLLPDLRRYGVTFMNYVGKPLALVLATPRTARRRRQPAAHHVRQRGHRTRYRRLLTAFRLPHHRRIRLQRVRRRRGPRGRYPPARLDRQGWVGVSIYDPDTLTECATAVFFDDNGALLNADDAVGELVNTTGSGPFTGYYNDPAATSERLRHGMYWTGDLAYRDADGWIYLAGRTSDWMRVDGGENMAAAPIERILLRLPRLSQVAVYAVPTSGWAIR